MQIQNYYAGALAGGRRDGKGGLSAQCGPPASQRCGRTVSPVPHGRGEILGLRWKDVDLDRATIPVTRTLEQTKDALVFKEPKIERSKRTIALAALTIEALRRHRAQQAELRLKLGPPYAADHDLVCCHPRGEALSPRAITKAFSVVAKNRGLKLRFTTCAIRISPTSLPQAFTLRSRVSAPGMPR